jgi:hypothetical protein
MAVGMLGTAAVLAVGRMPLDTPAVVEPVATLEEVAAGLMTGPYNVLIKLEKVAPVLVVGMAVMTMLGVEVGV